MTTSMMRGFHEDKGAMLMAVMGAVVMYLLGECGAYRHGRAGREIPDRDRPYQAHQGFYPRASNINIGDHIHGVKMGISNRQCDDGVHRLWMDWDPRSGAEYMCSRQEFQASSTINSPPIVLEDKSKERPMLHHCMDKRIEYKTDLPLSGDHRPLWPVYGEYRYLPPQRWLHSVEHGALVLLYHPCMRETAQLQTLKQIVRGCIRKHVISPYRKIPGNMPFALVAYRHGIAFNQLSNDVVESFIKKYAMKAPEAAVARDGQYLVGLMEKARVVSDMNDSNLCPSA